MTLIAVAAAGPMEDDVVAHVETSVAAAFAAETRRLPDFPDPDFAWDGQRNQYSSTLILRDALARRPADAPKLLVLTDRDMFIPMLSFVYGQAQLDGPAALVSVTRLRQEFYGLPANRPLLLLRVRKEAQHELGHAFGLTHCSDAACTMSLSTNIRQLDRKAAAFCGSCAVLLAGATRATGETR